MIGKAVRRAVRKTNPSIKQKYWMQIHNQPCNVTLLICRSAEALFSAVRMIFQDDKLLFTLFSSTLQILFVSHGALLGASLKCDFTTLISLNPAIFFDVCRAQNDSEKLSPPYVIRPWIVIMQPCSLGPSMGICLLPDIPKGATSSLDFIYTVLACIRCYAVITHLFCACPVQVKSRFHPVYKLSISTRSTLIYAWSTRMPPGKTL